MNLIIAGIVVAAILLFLLLRVLVRRESTPNRWELVTGVWAAFGPYESVEDAERLLIRSVRVVVGESTHKHDAWAKTLVDTFRLWEKSGTFKQNIELMQKGLAAYMVGPDFEAACARFKEESKAEALRLVDTITTELGMEKDAPALRAMIDGSMSAEAIHEELEASQKERAERVVRAIGENVFNYPSDKAAQLRTFLQELSREHKGEEATTPEAMGLLYLKCITYSGDNPDSEFAQTFHKLDDEWKASAPHEEAP